MKRLGVLIAALVALATLTSCGGDDNTTYRPAAYGEYGHCYYVYSPSEVFGLQRDGYCPRSWIPYPMPYYWHVRYAPYYASPAYYGYVPRTYRTVYIQQQTTFVNSNQSQIKSAVATAQYKGSNGKTVPGSKFGTSTFSSGNSRGGFGGGSNRTKTCGMSEHTGPLTLVMKGGGSGGGFGGGGSRGGYGGGSSRSGGGSSRSGGSGRVSGSRGGC